MQKLDFFPNWIDLRMKCITTRSFSVFINGVPKHQNQPQKGLRQECPLSQYLFLLYAEAFSNILAQRNPIIHGLKFNSNPSITYLLVADDSLVFIKATNKDYKNLKSIFDCYASTSS